MREILFKAKRIDNGEWLKGWVCQSSDGKTYIVGASKRGYIDGLEVIPDTICQYTGLTDKNGNKIWENDLIECKSRNHHFISQIEWDDWCKGFMFQDTKNSACGLDAIGDCGCYKNFKVIGNIFDNPKLMKGGVVQKTSDEEIVSEAGEAIVPIEMMKKFMRLE